MELWIRSQDRTDLIKVERILCKEYGISNISKKVYNLIGFTKNNDFIIGTYKTKERALEVLDEIHQRLISLGTIEIAPDSYIVLPKDTSNVYEIPKE